VEVRAGQGEVGDPTQVLHIQPRHAEIAHRAHHCLPAAKIMGVFEQRKQAEENERRDNLFLMNLEREQKEHH